MILGVCEDLGLELNTDPIIFRIIFLVLFFGYGIGLLLYILLYLYFLWR